MLFPIDEHNMDNKKTKNHHDLPQDSLRPYSRDELVGELLEGHSMSTKNAAKYERLSEKDPHNLLLHARLLGFYYTRRFKRKMWREKRTKKMDWLIKNYPDHPFLAESFCWPMKSTEPEAYKSIKRLWLKQIERHPKNAQIIANAAATFVRYDRELAKKLLSSAKMFKSENATVNQVLSRIEKAEEREAARKLDPAELDELVPAWIAAIDSGCKPESEHYWAAERIMNIELYSDSDSLWLFILAVCKRELSDTVKGRLAAGPIEDLIGKHGEDYIDRIEELASRNECFKDALGGVWQTDRSKKGKRIWKRIEAIRGEPWPL